MPPPANLPSLKSENSGNIETVIFAASSSGYTTLKCSYLFCMKAFMLLLVSGMNNYVFDTWFLRNCILPDVIAVPIPITFANAGKMVVQVFTG
jgi:hypothetical protein